MHADSPDSGTGKMCLGGGVHCPNASSYNYSRRVKQNLLLHLKGSVHKSH